MTTEEIAQAIQHIRNPYPIPDGREIAIALRQQAQRIAELERRLRHAGSWITMDRAFEGLDMPPSPTPSPKCKTVRVRVAVAIDSRGEWSARGYSDYLGSVPITKILDGILEPGDTLYWITADLPIPQVPEIPATVERAQLEATDG